MGETINKELGTTARMPATAGMGEDSEVNLTRAVGRPVRYGGKEAIINYRNKTIAEKFRFTTSSDGPSSSNNK